MRQLQSTDKTGRSPNERFCKSGAVTPQKVLCEFESLYPAGTFVEAPLRKAAGTLHVSR